MNIKFFIFILFFIGLQTTYCENQKNILYPKTNCPDFCEKKSESISAAPLRLALKKINGNEYSYFWRQSLTRKIFCCKDSSVAHIDQIILPKNDEYILKSECDFVKIERGIIFVNGAGLCSVILDSLKFIFETKDNGSIKVYDKFQ